MSNISPILPKNPKIKKDHIKTSFKLQNENFCFCSCFSSENILDSKGRKDTWYRLVKGAKKTIDDDFYLSTFENQIIDPLRVLKHLYSKNNENSIEMLKACRINPNLDPDSILREDLEFYVPQLCNFIIFHEDFKNIELNGFLQEACEIDFFFSHLVYWSLKSLSKLINMNSVEEFPIIKEPLNCIVDMCSEVSKNKFLLAYYELHELLVDLPQSQLALAKNKDQIRAYGTKTFVLLDEGFIKASDIVLQNYSSFFSGEVEEVSGFLSTVNFFEDLVRISEEIVKTNKKDRLKALKENLQTINEKLPSAVYIPFFKNGVRNNAVLKIVADEAVVFSTKERAPYYICLEIFRPEEDYALEKLALEDSNIQAKAKAKSIIKEISHFQEIDRRLSRPMTIKENTKKIFEKFRASATVVVSPDNSTSLKKNNFNSFNSMIEENNHEDEKIHSKTLEENFISHKISEEEEHKLNHSNDSLISKISGVGYFYGNKENSKNILNPNDLDLSYMSIKTDNQENSPSKSKKSKLIFGEDSHDQKERIRENSVFKHLKTWDLVHLIIKTHDNLKQEQFALQLIYQFDQIFRLENLNLKLRPYEVLALGPDCGVMEMIKDAITIDALKRKMHEKYKNLANLNEFFQFHFGNQLEQARFNFCCSLAAYSLVCYILQIKDRHNGNILLNKDGFLLHIDFGFFLSNMPGKGLEFEKAVPFKLLSEYVEVLGGRNSGMFSRFRKLFYQGFKAVRKHKDKILLLVKMMYSIHGNTLPCFKAGEKSILELEERFEPKGIKSEGELNIYIQNLINESLDNLRTRWYDKFQYYCQGIFY